MFIFSIINYFLFNDIYPYYESLYQSFISSFNIGIITSLYKEKQPSKIFNNLFLSKYSIIFIYFQVVFFFFSISIFVATLAYMFKNAILFQEEPEEKDAYMEKLKEIEEKLEEKKEKEEINKQSNDLDKKQIIWFSLDNEKNEMRQFVDIGNNDILFFKTSSQIISFLKYIFTMKPHLQHVKLMHKLNIVIETNQRSLESKSKNELNKLTDWLIFIECKIPLIFYGNTRFDSSYKIKLKSLYKGTLFISNKKELDKILKNTGEKVIAISPNENFTLCK